MALYSPRPDSRAGLTATGLLIPIRIAIPAEVRAVSSSGADDVFGQALIDTGAELTCVATTVLDHLGVPGIMESLIRTPAGTSVEQLYIVSLELPDLEFVLDPVAVSSLSLFNTEPGEVIALLGRNVLSRLHLEWHGPDGTWSIST